MEEEKQTLLQEQVSKLNDLEEENVALKRKIAELSKQDIPEMPPSPQEKGVLGTFWGWFSGDD